MIRFLRAKVSALIREIRYSLTSARTMVSAAQNRAISRQMGIPVVSGAEVSGMIEKYIGIAIALVIIAIVFANALPTGINALVDVDTTSTVFNTFMNTIAPLIVAAVAILLLVKMLRADSGKE